MSESCYKTLCFVFMAFPGIFSMSVEPFSLMRKPKPNCEAMEACGIFLGRVLPLQCACAEGKQCAAENRLVDNKNMKPYVLCEPVEELLPVCEQNDIALELSGYRHKFRCQCPEDLELVSLSWDMSTDTTLYSCSKLRDCSTDGEVCARKMKVFAPKVLSNLRSLCGCPANQRCRNEAKFTNRTMEITEWSCE